MSSSESSSHDAAHSSPSASLDELDDFGLVEDGPSSDLWIKNSCKKKPKRHFPPQKKTESAAEGSSFVAQDDIGLKLMQKMGYQPGQGLGVDLSGRTEPILPTMRTDKAAGIGASPAERLSPQLPNPTQPQRHQSKKKVHWSAHENIKAASHLFSHHHKRMQDQDVFEAPREHPSEWFDEEKGPQTEEERLKRELDAFLGRETKKLELDQQQRINDTRSRITALKHLLQGKQRQLYALETCTDLECLEGEMQVAVFAERIFPETLSDADFLRKAAGFEWDARLRAIPEIMRNVLFPRLATCSQKSLCAVHEVILAMAASLPRALLCEFVESVWPSSRIAALSLDELFPSNLLDDNRSGCQHWIAICATLDIDSWSVAILGKMRSAFYHLLSIQTPEADAAILQMLEALQTAKAARLYKEFSVKVMRPGLLHMLLQRHQRPELLQMDPAKPSKTLALQRLIRFRRHFDPEQLLAEAGVWKELAEALNRWLSLSTQVNLLEVEQWYAAWRRLFTERLGVSFVPFRPLLDSLNAFLDSLIKVLDANH